MVPSMPSRPLRARGLSLAVVSAALLGAFAASTAQAAVVIGTQPFNEALSFSYNPLATGIGGGDPCCDYQNVIKAASAGAATNSYSQSGAWGSVNAYASADLATGQLKMRSAAASGDGSASPSSQSNAIFGDGFRAATSSGSAYTWLSSSRARFTLDLSGTMTSSRPLDGTFNADAFVILSILQKDTLDPNQPLINGPTAQQYFFWNIGNPTATIYYTDQNHNSQVLTPTAQYADIPATITADFSPGGDFDWVLLFGASGQVSGTDSFDFDLSHTLNLSFSGPDGSVMSAVSNQFANFGATLPDAAAVPEPGSAAIVLIALAGLAATRRRR